MVKQNIVKNRSKIKTGADKLASEFKILFADIGPSLAKDIPDLSMSFESFLKRVNTTLPSQSLSISKPKDAFFSLSKQTKVLVLMKKTAMQLSIVLKNFVVLISTYLIYQHKKEFLQT